MKTSVVSPFVVALLALFMASVAPLPAQTTATKARKIPFHGTLQAFDASAQTITLASKKEPAGRVFHLQSTTKITDGEGNPTTLASAVVGEDVGGSYDKDASGNLNLYSLRLGAKAGSKSKSAATSDAAAPAPTPAPAASTPAPAPTPAPVAETPAKATTPATTTAAASGKKVRFSGKVVSVDAASNTLVVHGKADQTFTVTSDTKITGAANLGAINAGAKVSGSYQKSADGSTMTVTSLKVTQ